MFWPIFWGLIMLGLVAATTTVAMREKKAKAAAMKKFAPQPLDGSPADESMEPAGFGEPDPVDSFGMDDDAQVATLDSDNFK